jgi:cell division protein FtsX
MAARPTYLIKESLSNLRRNVLMTVTAVITIVVSLTIVGASLLLRQGMNNSSSTYTCSQRRHRLSSTRFAPSLMI